MTDLSSFPRRSPEPAGPESVSDVLASIRRLIAQDDGSRFRREPAPPRRAAVAEPEVSVSGTGVSVVDDPAPSARLAPVPSDPLPSHPGRAAPVEAAPLRLQSAALVAPADPAPAPAAVEFTRPRLRLAALAGALSEEPEVVPAPDAEPAARANGGAAADPAPMVECVAADAAAGTAADPEPEKGIRSAAPAWPARPAAAPAAHPATSAPAPEPAASAGPAAAPPRPRVPDPADDSTALHLFAPADEDIPNGSILRSLLRESIRQELQGEMGGRFSRNLRRVIRQEVAFAVAEAIRARDA